MITPKQISVQKRYGTYVRHTAVRAPLGSEVSAQVSQSPIRQRASDSNMTILLFHCTVTTFLKLYRVRIAKTYAGSATKRPRLEATQHYIACACHRIAFAPIPPPHPHCARSELCKLRTLVMPAMCIHTANAQQIHMIGTHALKILYSEAAECFNTMSSTA
jgi:hypothetical protein